MVVMVELNMSYPDFGMNKATKYKQIGADELAFP